MFQGNTPKQNSVCFVQTTKKKKKKITVKA